MQSATQTSRPRHRTTPAPKTRPTVRPPHIMLAKSWVQEMIEAASPLTPASQINWIDPVWIDGCQCLSVLGNVLPHIDYPDDVSDDLSYLLVLRAKNATLHAAGFLDLALKPGMLVELNHRRMHSLTQPDENFFVWSPFDTSNRQTLEQAEEAQHFRWINRLQLPDRQHMQAIDAGIFDISYDGRTVWINGPEGGCIGRFGPKGVDIHFPAKLQAIQGAQCFACTHTMPTLNDWTRFTDLMANIGAQIPSAAQPRWLT